MNNAPSKIVPPSNDTSDQVCHPTGLMKARIERTNNGGKTTAIISVEARTPIPLMGNSKNCLTSHFLCGLNCLVTLMKGLIKKQILRIIGIQITINTYAAQGPSGGNSGMLIGVTTVSLITIMQMNQTVFEESKGML